MKLFVITRSGSCATETEIVRAESLDEAAPPIQDLSSPFDRQTVEELFIDGPPGVIYANCYIE